jgi:carboxybiotin decarboxylase
MQEDILRSLWETTGVYHITPGQIIMIGVGCLLVYLAIARQFEPLLLIPIGFGAILSNVPIAEISGPEGLLGILYSAGVSTGVFPLLIFMGVGAHTDFGALIANPRTLLLGAAAQFGIFLTLLGALAMNVIPGLDFSLQDAAAIGIIGGADGPTAIFLATRLSPSLLGAIAVAAYSYMALVPIIQPPIMRLLTTHQERATQMEELRSVSRMERILFPFTILVAVLLFLPAAVPLIGMLVFGNLLRECGVVERLARAAQNEIINAVTIFLGLSVGSKLNAEEFLNPETLGILTIGFVAFAIGTAAGVLMGKGMYLISGGKINPLIGAAGVSAVPMSARVVNKVGLEANPNNYLLMHAMGPNVAGVIGSAVAAGFLLSVLG